jgi:hypothetical protein
MYYTIAKYFVYYPDCVRCSCLFFFCTRVHPLVVSGVRVARSLACWSLFVLLFIFFWPLCCLSFFNIRILLIPLLSSNSSYIHWLWPFLYQSRKIHSTLDSFINVQYTAELVYFVKVVKIMYYPLKLLRV